MKYVSLQVHLKLWIKDFFDRSWQKYVALNSEPRKEYFPVSAVLCCEIRCIQPRLCALYWFYIYILPVRQTNVYGYSLLPPIQLFALLRIIHGIHGIIRYCVNKTILCVE